MAKFIKLFCVTGLSMVLLCLTSCEQKQEPVKREKQVMVVNKSIDLPKKNKKKGVSTPENSARKEVHEKKNKVAVTAVHPLVPKKKNEIVKAAVPTPAITKPAPLDEKSQEHPPEMAIDGTPIKTKSYDTKGRVDPFIPLL